MVNHGGPSPAGDATKVESEVSLDEGSFDRDEWDLDEDLILRQKEK